MLPYRVFSDLKHTFKAFTSHDEDKSIWDIYREIGKAISDKFSELVDYKQNDSRKLCKLNYSLALYAKKSYVCYPFISREEFYNFKLEDAEPQNVIDKVQMRGQILFNAVNPGNIKELLKELHIKEVD